MKKVLVTGSAGFIGSHFVEHLLVKTDWQIIGLDSFRHKGDSERVIKHERYKIYSCDLSCPVSYRLISKIGCVDYIVNLASESHVDRSISDPVRFIQNNVNLMLYVLEFAKEQPLLSKFIQISTDEVYGPASDGVAHREWSSILPSNPYAASKAAQEAIVISYWRTYGLPLMITNTMNNFGERQDPEKYVPMLIKKIKEGKTISVHGNKNEIGKRMYIHARNFSDALLYLLKEINPIRYSQGVEEKSRPSRFNIVGEVEVDNLEMAWKVGAVMGKAVQHELVDFHSARPGHDPCYRLDGTKLKQAGWKQPVNFEQSLKKTIEWTLAHPEWLK